MDFKLISSEERKLVGISKETTLSTDNPVAFWSAFMPRFNEIPNKKNTHKFAVQQYNVQADNTPFGPETPFIKWACAEVSSFASIPEGMDTLLVPAGKFAVFTHQGSMEKFAKTMQYIYGEWAHTGKYKLGFGPHFQLMDERYLGPENPASIEEIWVPLIGD